MLFNLLRKYFKDYEFEQIHNQLAESKLLLNEYKTYIQEQKDAFEREKKVVDADFLTLIWASIAVGIAFGAESVNNLPDKKILFNTPSNSIWSIFAITALVFVVTSLIIAIDLTIKYADEKGDKKIKVFAIILLIGITILVFGLFLLAFAQDLGLP